MYVKKGYKILSLKQLSNIVAVSNIDAEHSNHVRVLWAWLYYQARQEATERTLKKDGHHVRPWTGPDRSAVRKLVGGRKSLNESLKYLREIGLINLKNKKITINEGAIYNAEELAKFVSGEKTGGTTGRRTTRNVAVMHDWMKKWAEPERARYNNILHQIYVMAGVSFGKRTGSQIKNAGRFKFKDLQILFPTKERTLERARASLIREGRISEDKTYRRWIIKKYGHYFSVNLDWAQTSREQTQSKIKRIEMTDNSTLKCTEVTDPYRDYKHSMNVRDQKTRKCQKVSFKCLDLKNPKEVDRAYIELVSKNKISDNPLMRLYTHAAAIKALSEKNVRDKQALFYWVVLKKEWGRLKESYEIEAKRRISELPEHFTGRVKECRSAELAPNESREEVSRMVLESLREAA